jgi:hypothetical protein
MYGPTKPPTADTLLYSGMPTTWLGPRLMSATIVTPGPLAAAAPPTVSTSAAKPAATEAVAIRGKKAKNTPANSRLKLPRNK